MTDIFDALAAVAIAALTAVVGPYGDFRQTVPDLPGG